MPPHIVTDADRLEAIQKLERTIQAKQPELQAALARRDAAVQQEEACHEAARGAEQESPETGPEIHQAAAGVYLNGGRLDRGTLRLDNDMLTFAAWHGKAEIPLKTVVESATGTSNLPGLAGVPVLERIWPGAPRPAQTLLLAVQPYPQSPMQIAVIADLKDAGQWQSWIREQKGQLERLQARRAELVEQQEPAMRTWNEAREALKKAEADLWTVESELNELKEQQGKLRAQQEEVNAAREKAARAQQEKTPKKRKR